MNKKKAFSGYVGDCSELQLQALAKFRSKVTEMGLSKDQYDDVYLLRFLRARKFDLVKTTEMWTNYINWRRAKNVDEIAKMEFPEMDRAKEFYPHTWFRTDKKGRPIFIERVGKIKFDKLIQNISVERLEQHFIHDYEKLMNEKFPACTKAKGELVCNTVYIMDLKGFSTKMLSGKVMDVLKTASKIGQDNYPEILGDMFIVNAPMVFYGAWNVIKHFVDEKTRKKVHILGSSYKKELLQHIDENDLPDFLGGKVTAKDYGEHFTNSQGPWASSSPSSSNGPTREASQEEKANFNVDDYRPSIELKDEEEEQEDDDCYSKSVPVIQDRRGSFEQLETQGLFDTIGQESPIKHCVKNFRPKPSISFNAISSLKSFGEA